MSNDELKPWQRTNAWMAEHQIGEKLKAVRKARGMRLYHVELAGICTHGTLTMMERNCHSPSLELAARLCDHYGITLDELLEVAHDVSKSETALPTGLPETDC